MVVTRGCVGVRDEVAISGLGLLGKGRVVAVKVWRSGLD
jgi:hypothetical protein